MTNKVPRAAAGARRRLARFKPFTRWVEDRRPTLEDAFVWLGLVGDCLNDAQLDEEAEAQVRERLEVDVARLLPPTVLTGPYFRG